MISVIIPVFGRVALLRACIDSIIASYDGPLEIIIVDDGNVGADAATVQEITAHFQAQYVKLAERRGAAAARNAGARSARGSYIFFADADIVMRAHALSHLMDALERDTQASFAYGDYLLQGHCMRGRNFSLDALRQNNYISTMTLLRADGFCGFDETLKRFQDWDLWLTLTERGLRGVYVPEIMYSVDELGTMSRWLPSFCARRAVWFRWIPRVRAYDDARKVVVLKHDLPRR